MKKILCLIDSLGIGGGAERQMVGLAMLLQEKGYQVDLVAYYNHDSYPELLAQPNLKIYTLKTGDSKWSKLMAVKHHIKSSGGYDCVIAYKDGPTIISCLLRLLGVKFRLIVSERNTNQGLSVKDKVKFFLYRFADYIVPNSYSQADFINQNFPNLKERVKTITNFTDTIHFHPIETINNDKINVLTVARIASQKNILNYLAAIKLLKVAGFAHKVHFNWYGPVQPGEEVYGETCFNKMIELGLEDMIEFHPATSEIAKQYQACDIFCLPSIYEGFPNVVCEAMSCGKPIVCSRVCDNPYIVQENQNGILFDPENPQDIYMAIKSAIEMPDAQRIKWGKYSRSIAESMFSKESFVSKYINIL